MTEAAPGGPRPPLFFLAALGIQAALHFLAPTCHLIPGRLVLIGVPFIVLGLVMIVTPARSFDRVQTAIDPFGSPSHLVTDGWFRISRNPMYLGMVSALLGAAILFGTLAPLLVVPLFMLLIDRRFIRHEEATLNASFGAAYAEYRRRVRRWL